MSPNTLDISGDNTDGSKSSDSWKHAFLPIKNPIDINKGDVLYVNFSRKYPNNSTNKFRQIYRWRGYVERNSNIIGEFYQSLNEADLQ
ncbi:MAG: hypothetical protein QM503_05425 [Bacteroidota bacterium]